MKLFCILYPKSYSDTCICDAGADVSGSVNSDPYVCSEEYSETCPWLREWMKENFPELI